MTCQWLPINLFIQNGVRELGISRTELSRRCGYENLSKGIDRIDEVCRGDLTSAQAKAIIEALPFALEIPKEKLAEAVIETAKIIEEARSKETARRESAWRAAFRPHAIIATERSIPEPIFAAVFIGINRILRVDFDLASGPASFVQQGLNGVRLKLAEFPNPSCVLPCFGRPIGLVVNYEPHRAVRFDLEGRAIAILSGVFRLGEATLSIRTDKLRR